MTDELGAKQTESTTAPITVAVIDTGTGSTPLAAGIARTEGTQPNLRVKIVTPLMAISVRFANTFLVTFMGIIGPSAYLFGLDIKKVVLLALSAAILDCGKNLITVFGRLESKFPLATGNV
jgi:hypothetical protein